MEPLRWIERQQISEEKWSACVNAHPNGASLFAQTWYLDACATHWSALVYGDYQAVLPLCWRKKWGIHYVYPPFFVAQLGILGAGTSGVSSVGTSGAPSVGFSGVSSVGTSGAPSVGFSGASSTVTSAGSSPALAVPPVDAWIRAIPRRFLYVELVLNAENRLPLHWPVKCQTHQTFLLDCRQPYEVLQSAYHQNHRRNLKKALQAGLQITHEVKDADVIDWFRSNRGQEEAVSFREDDYDRLLRLLSLLRERHALETWGVRDNQGRLCAAAFFPFLNGRYTFLFSGRTGASQENRAMFFLIDRFIHQHAGEDCLLDFNGSNNPRIAKFYQGFGADRQTFNQLFVSIWKRLK